MSSTGRNDPCWCDSGKKYKKCHLTSDQELLQQLGTDIQPGSVVMCDEAAVHWDGGSGEDFVGTFVKGEDLAGYFLLCSKCGFRTLRQFEERLEDLEDSPVLELETSEDIEGIKEFISSNSIKVVVLDTLLQEEDLLVRSYAGSGPQVGDPVCFCKHDNKSTMHWYYEVTPSVTLRDAEGKEIPLHWYSVCDACVLGMASNEDPIAFLIDSGGVDPANAIPVDQKFLDAMGPIQSDLPGLN